MLVTLQFMRRIDTNNIKAATYLAFALIPLSGFVLDIYIPSLPEMSSQLHTTPAAIQLTLSIYLITYGISQLLIGAFLDSVGRFLPSTIALFLFSLSSFYIANADSIKSIYLMRAFQGIMVATIVVSKRASFFDLYAGEKLKHYTSLFSVIWSAAPIIAPFLGGFLQVNYGWRSNFYFLGIFGIILMLLEILFSGESIVEKHPFKLKLIISDYTAMLRTRDFTTGIIILALAYSILMVYNMSSPFLVEKVMHYPANITGNAALFSGVAMMAGGLLSKYYIDKPFTTKIKITFGIQITGAILVMFINQWYNTMYTLLAYITILHIGTGFIFNTVFSYCLTRFATNGGKASGLSGGGYIIFTAAFSFGVIRSLPIDSQFWLGTSYLILVLITVFLFLRTKWINN